MKTLRMTILSLSALIVFLSSSQALAGSTDLRIRTRVRMPMIKVDVGPSIRCGNDSRMYVRRALHVTRQDRRIARRLSGYTGIPSYEFLELRDRGFKWSKIARRLDLSRRVVRAAHSAKSWRRFLRPIHRCGNL